MQPVGAPNIILTAGSERQYCLSEIEWQFYPASWPRMPKAWLKDCTVANSRAIHNTLPSPDTDAVYLRLGHQPTSSVKLSSTVGYGLDRVQNKDERGGIYAWRWEYEKKSMYTRAGLWNCYGFSPEVYQHRIRILLQPACRREREGGITSVCIEFKFHINYVTCSKKGNYMNKRSKHITKFLLTEATTSFQF